MKVIIVAFLVYISFDLFAYFSRDNNYIGEWRIEKVVPKNNSFSSKEFSTIVQFSKYANVSSNIYLTNSSFELYYDGRRVAKSSISFANVKGKTCFGAYMPDKCFIKNGKNYYISNPLEDIYVKSVPVYYFLPGFIDNSL